MPLVVSSCPPSATRNLSNDSRKNKRKLQIQYALKVKPISYGPAFSSGLVDSHGVVVPVCNETNFPT